MISFRQYVVTIVAIFLALALGVLAGSAFVQPRLIETLETQVDQQRERIAEQQGELGELRDLLDAERAFNDFALPHLTAGRLTGQDVLVIAQEGVEDAVVGATRQALGEAGAVPVVLSARVALAPLDTEAQTALAEILGVPDAAPEDLPLLAAEVLAERLATGSPRAVGTSQESDLLHTLLTEGYLAPIDANVSDETLETIGGAGQLVVVLAGGTAEDPLMAPERFAIPLVERLADLGVPVAAGESVGTVVPFVPLIRAGGLEGVVTVDDLDESRGGASLVLGLERLQRTGDGGDYGVKDGATPLPPPP